MPIFGSQGIVLCLVEVGKEDGNYNSGSRDNIPNNGGSNEKNMENTLDTGVIGIDRKTHWILKTILHDLSILNPKP